MDGVRDRSKMLPEDPVAQAKRLLEQRRTDKAERAAGPSPASASRSTSSPPRWIGVEFGRSALDSVAAGVSAGGHRGQGWQSGGRRRGHPHRGAHERAGQAGLHPRRRRGQAQEKRVQKCVETLDAFRAKNAAAPKANNGNANANGHTKARAQQHHLPPRPPPVSQRRNFQASSISAPPAPAPPTESWESFDCCRRCRPRPRPP
ncbi:hypothetical protein BS78_10G128900 [Paspalum vaginatum]|nr:hypothetical protein BS78_10G128900 [Paspalum vaginatum]